MRQADEWKKDRDEEERSLTDGVLEETLGRMAEEYEAVKIPAELKLRVEQTIEETEKMMKLEENRKNENRGTGNRNGQNRPRHVVLIRTAQTAAAALLAITVLANTSASTAYAMERIPIIGAITKVVTFRTYEKKEGNTEAKIEVPKVEAEKNSGISEAADEVNRSVEDYTNQIISQFEKEVQEDGAEGHRALYSDYQVLADNDKYFTLELRIDEIMASGAQSVKIYNIDKQTNQILKLKDLFPDETGYVAKLSEAVKEEMRRNMKEDESKVYFLDSEYGDNFETIKEDQNFYINEAGNLVLVFDEYEVAPGSMGLVEIELPQTVYHAEQADLIGVGD